MPVGKIRGNSLSLDDLTLILSTVVSHAILSMTKKLRNISCLDAIFKQIQLLASFLIFISTVLSPGLLVYYLLLLETNTTSVRMEVATQDLLF